MLAFPRLSPTKRTVSLSLATVGFALMATGCNACGSAVPEPVPLMATPMPLVADHTFIMPPTALAVAAVFDITTSADRFGPEAKSLVARSIAAWPTPGRGGLDLTISVLSSRSWDAASQLLAIHLDGLPQQPVRGETLSRPGMPLLDACTINTFNRAKCTSQATADYNEALARVLDDEGEADRELVADLSSFEEIVQRRKTEASDALSRIDSLILGLDGKGSDVNGALLRAAESLKASKASRRVLLVQSDLVPYGRQQPGSLDLSGIEVVVYFFDCPQGMDCGAHRLANEQAFLAAGAASVRWLDPGASRLTTNILQEVR